MLSAKVIINLDALRFNFQQVKKLAPQSKILAVIKADAYGHGAVQIAKALPDADALGVARLHEAILLRQAGLKKPIVLLEGVLSASELQQVIEHELDMVIHNPQQIRLVEQQTLGAIRVWLKINTGMNRIGVKPDQFADCLQRLTALNHVREIILMSHFANADNPNDQSVSKQMQCFDELTQSLPHEKSFANSAAILTNAASHHQWVRPGLMLYGISPCADIDIELKPVMTFKAPIITIQKLAKGEGVGYGLTWRSPADDYAIAILSCGYADGFPYKAGNRANVWLAGKSLPVIGKVSMDMMAIDINALFEVNVGDEVTLWGEKNTVAQLAANVATIPYEILCGISRRVKFVYQVAADF